MKKGFTLIELLIVVVIVSVLVTIALPKYRASMERGRAMEGLTNLKASSDWINTKYIMNENVYPDDSKLFMTDNVSGYYVSAIGANTRSVFFTPIEISEVCTSGYKCLRTQRKQGDSVFYTLIAYNKNGELKKITCTGTEKKLCEPLGMTLSGSEYVMTF